MSSSVAVRAPAKLNLALSVAPPGPDGKHPISSWMVTVNLFDDLLVARLEEDRLSRYAILWHAEARRRSDINWSVAKDLAVRAHLALERHVERRLPVQLKLEKRIPVGGGLGGGSSDAAAMLRAVNQLFDLRLSLDELAAVGATVGADVPFLVYGGSAIVEGVGEKVSRLSGLPALHAVIVFPDVECPTARVYARYNECAGPGLRGEEIRTLASTSGIAAGSTLFNDLTASAIAIAPRLEQDIASLAQLAERPAHLSGSGSSLFVLCDDEPHAIALAEIVERKLDLPAVHVRSCII